MAKEIYMTLSLKVSDEMFKKISRGMTEEQKKYLEKGKLIPSPGLSFWNSELAEYIKTHASKPGFLSELVADLQANIDQSPAS